MGLLDDVTGKLDELKDTVADKAKELKDEAVAKAGELKDKTVDKATEFKDKTVERAGELKDKVVDQAKELKEGAENKLTRGVANFGNSFEFLQIQEEIFMKKMLIMLALVLGVSAMAEEAATTTKAEDAKTGAMATMKKEAKKVEEKA